MGGTEMETPDGEGLVLGAREGGVTPEVRTCPWKGTSKVLERGEHGPSEELREPMEKPPGGQGGASHIGVSVTP